MVPNLADHQHDKSSFCIPFLEFQGHGNLHSNALQVALMRRQLGKSLAGRGEPRGRAGIRRGADGRQI